MPKDRHQQKVVSFGAIRSESKGFLIVSLVLGLSVGLLYNCN